MGCGACTALLIRRMELKSKHTNYYYLVFSLAHPIQLIGPFLWWEKKALILIFSSTSGTWPCLRCRRRMPAEHSRASTNPTWRQLSPSLWAVIGTWFHYPTCRWLTQHQCKSRSIISLPIQYFSICISDYYDHVVHALMINILLKYLNRQGRHGRILLGPFRPFSSHVNLPHRLRCGRFHEIWGRRRQRNVEVQHLRTPFGSQPSPVSLFLPLYVH